MNGAELRGLAEEQAALRRVATLVARGLAAEELFRAVTEEVGRVLSAEYVQLIRYEPDHTATTLAGSGAGPVLPAGTRLKLGGKNVTTVVFETGRSARLDDYGDASGPFAVAPRQRGTQLRSSVATPIVVEASQWGVMVVGSSEVLPPETEARLASFTELVATAVANAESRAALARLAEEQAALRRVATLAAGGTRQDELFAVVTEEVGRLLPAEYAHLARYEPNGTFVVVGAWSGDAGEYMVVGSRGGVGGTNLVTSVFETGRSARMDDYADASGPSGVLAREQGVRSAVATPIVVEGRVWGVAIAGSLGERALPDDAEARLGSFTELVATAIANAQSRVGLARLAEQQEALRRVATLVARGVPPEEVFASVTEEVQRLLLCDVANLARFESDSTFTIVASAGVRFPVGSRMPMGKENLATILVETGRPCRLEDIVATGPLADRIRDAGVHSAVGTPVIVEDHLWGGLSVGSTRESLAPDTEARLSSFTELVATAIANAESRAALGASRARIVAAADESRRQIERDLHDGAQQRLVQAVIMLKLAQRALSAGHANASELVTEALSHAEQAQAELRELAHGILPAALTRGGLRAGVESLVSRVSLPVSVDVSVARLPAGVEATAYFVISEALTNVVKHARADRAGVLARFERGELHVEVRDDGVGGAQGGDGTGLGGLQDRVAALDGRFVLESPPGGGTRVCALLPVGG